MRLCVLASVIVLLIAGCAQSAQLPVAPGIVVSAADTVTATVEGPQFGSLDR
ncbi:MAG TPA: hypothetical protein VGA78_04000 [Gemmatimonadales bacterium]|jgi:hypothetical protein